MGILGNLDVTDWIFLPRDSRRASEPFESMALWIC